MLEVVLDYALVISLLLRAYLSRCAWLPVCRRRVARRLVPKPPVTKHLLFASLTLDAPRPRGRGPAPRGAGQICLVLNGASGRAFAASDKRRAAPSGQIMIIHKVGGQPLAMRTKKTKKNYRRRKKENVQPKGGMGGRHAATTQTTRRRDFFFRFRVSFSWSIQLVKDILPPRWPRPSPSRPPPPPPTQSHQA